MPYNNKGFDFICDKGYKIDVKSSCFLTSRPNMWAFKIRYNTIADYFLCLAFDNRKDLNPAHIWLIPGHIINHQTCASISKSTLDRWHEYELIDKLGEVMTCCDAMKQSNVIEERLKQIEGDD